MEEKKNGGDYPVLRLKDIHKDYKVPGGTFPALKGVTLNFRKNEFVSILGPSGSGKTTLLNIIGGLDHYTGGDLFIDGTSTKEFSDRDWDNYRNHKIGFVFQSYNLIPHQTVLQNVELALTIGGKKKAERQRRAKEALEKVGLGDYLNKKPSQLSGGQCQRVAIARALVNEPSILLADEPTGALDSQTSLQIMDLIQEVAKDRLVIMVTHNPELAERYSSRIIKLSDGKIIEDSMPYEEEEADKEEALGEGDKELFGRKSKLSFWQTLRLSWQNLWSKRGRNIMVAIAGSIGIVGVSAVLSVRSGVMNYIALTEDDMLSGYPISVATSSIDLDSIMNSNSNKRKAEVVSHSIKDGEIDIDWIIDELIQTANTQSNAMVNNNITADYLAFLEQMPENYVAAMLRDYGVNPMNNLYTEVTIDQAADNEKGYEAVSSSRSLSFMIQFASSIVRQTEYSSYASMVSRYGNALKQGISASDYVLSQYDVLAGNFPEKEDEMMLVLNHDDEATDFLLTTLGFLSQDEFLNAINYFNKDSHADKELFDASSYVSFDEVFAKKFTYYPDDTVYTQNSDLTSLTPFYYSDEEGEVYDASTGSSSLTGWSNGLPMKIVGILAPKKDVQYGCLDTGLYYTDAFLARFLKDGLTSKLASYLRAYEKQGGSLTSSYSKGISGAAPTKTGIVYDFSYFLDFHTDGKDKKPGTDDDSSYHQTIEDVGLVGDSSSVSSMMAILGSYLGMGSLSGSRSATVTSASVGGSTLPQAIYFYPHSFDEKGLVEKYLSTWNDSKATVYGRHQKSVESTDALGNRVSIPQFNEDGSPSLEEESKEIPYEGVRAKNKITYTDTLGVVIAMVDTIINIVTYALIVFTGLSLVVSTVMIAIITYVSVLERVKEIGVIRAMGGRKRDVANLFLAETFFLGLAAGIIGELVTGLFSLILNAVLAPITGVPTISLMTWGNVSIMILISMLLTMISGIIPAMHAANQDPVVALRSE